MRVLVVDDENLGLKRLTRMLEEMEVEHISFQDSQEALEFAQRGVFDVALLDISMLEIDGKELAKMLLELNPDAFVIFQTAYEEHALEAFKIGAIDYLLKPFSKEHLEGALRRAKEYQARAKKRFLVKYGDDSFVVEDSEIYYIEADLSEIVIRTRDEFFYYKEKISDIKKLMPKNFFKIHRSIIINVDKIKNIKTLTQSRLEFSFEGIDDVVVSSKEGAKKFREFFK